MEVMNNGSFHDMQLYQMMKRRRPFNGMLAEKKIHVGILFFFPDNNRERSRNFATSQQQGMSRAMTDV